MTHKYTFSLSALICCLFFACVAPTPPFAERYQDGLTETRALSERFGKISISPVDKIGASILDRLSAVLPQDCLQVEPKLTILNTSEAMAFSPGGGSIVVSRGIILSMDNESEFAFILAHELSHACLGHEMLSQNESNSDDLTQENELQADAIALQIISAAGYDARASIASVMHAYGAARINDSDAAHPAAAERVRALTVQIARNLLTLPGTVDKREFQELKSLLSNF